MVQPCDDIQVLDISSGQVGGIATMVLADFGADVIKIEPPGGDPARALAAAPMWLRGKRSVTLDLATPDGRTALHRLAAHADVVVSSFAPGAAEPLGADYATLAALNPALVYCSITGWGPRGPLAHYPVDEALVAAKSGRMWAFTGLVRREGPAYAAVPVAMHAASQAAVQGILAALRTRDRDGRGQLVETSLLQGLFPYDLSSLVREQLLTTYPQHMQTDWLTTISADTQPTLGYQPVVASDGRWIQFANLLEHLFHSSLEALGLTEQVLGDPRYAGAPSNLDPQALEEVRDLMLARVRERPADEWMRLFHENGNVAADLVGTAQQGMHHADMAVHGDVVETTWPAIGVVRQLGPIARLTETPGRIAGPPPTPGAHTAVVLAAPARASTAARTATADTTQTTKARNDAPLAGITVLEVATIIAAPLSASLLADLGARVIKIEATDGGDPMRGMGGSALGRQMIASKTTAGKESICIDLKTGEGRAIVQQLLAQADVLIHNFRPGVPDRLGIGYEQACAIRPDIVWVSASGYGPDGPSAHRPAAHPIPGAVDGGALLQAGEGWPSEPLDTLPAIREAARRFYRANEANPDPNTSMAIATATLLALRARERTGKGQRVYATMLGANAYANADDFLAYDGKPPRPTVDADLYGTHALRRLYRARDGWVFLSVLDTSMWERCCAALDRTDLVSGVTFNGGPVPTIDAHVADTLAAAFAMRDADEWERELIARNVGCVRADGVENIGQFLLHHEQITANGLDVYAEHAIFGRYRRWGPLVSFSDTPGRYGPGVLAGEQTDALLRECGYDGDAIAQLHTRGIVWSEPPLAL